MDEQQDWRGEQGRPEADGTLKRRSECGDGDGERSLEGGDRNGRLLVAGIETLPWL